jgi:hypothetical protein
MKDYRVANIRANIQDPYDDFYEILNIQRKTDTVSRALGLPDKHPWCTLSFDELQSFDDWLSPNSLFQEWKTGILPKTNTLFIVGSPGGGMWLMTNFHLWPAHILT